MPEDCARVPAPLRLHRTPVRSEWLDYNDHVSEWCYLLIFGDNADAFFRYVGIDEAYRAGGRSVFTAETHLHHLGEARAGDELALSLQLIDLDAKRLHVYHEVYRPGADRPLATAEQLLLSVDTVAGRVAPFPAELLGRLTAVQAAHAALPRPASLGHVMGVPRTP